MATRLSLTHPSIRTPLNLWLILEMFSAKEVLNHNQESDAWVTYKGQVLNITHFLETHPGGGEYLIPFLGKDITEVFEEQAHSTSAVKMVRDFHVGVLNTNENRLESAPKRPWDPTRGIVHQVWSKMSLPEYLDMVNNPTHLDDHVKMFDTPLLESLSRTPWYYVPTVWLPVMVYYLFLGFHGPVSVIQFLLGILMWTMLEYSLHRFVFHAETKIPASNFWMTFHFLSHGIHHAFPMDNMRLVFPIALSLILSFIVKGLYNSMFPSGGLCECLWAGTLFGYVFYDIFHYYIHHSKTHFAYSQDMKKYHMNHHYRHNLLGFGVSNKLWDVVFGTTIPDSALKNGKRAD